MIPPPITDAGVSVPFLGHLPFVWIVSGGVGLAAAVGVLCRRTWARYLGIVSEILTITGASMTARSIPSAATTLVIAGFVLFALWRRWPAPRTA